MQLMEALAKVCEQAWVAPLLLGGRRSLATQLRQGASGGVRAADEMHSWCANTVPIARAGRGAGKAQATGGRADAQGKAQRRDPMEPDRLCMLSAVHALCKLSSAHAIPTWGSSLLMSTLSPFSFS